VLKGAFMSDTKRTIAVVYLLGLSTFCLPLARVSIPVLGKSEWSTWDFWSLAAGSDHPAWWWLALGQLSLPYALLAVGLLLLWLPNYLTPSILWAALCLMSSGILRRVYWAPMDILNMSGGHLRPVYGGRLNIFGLRAYDGHLGTITASPEAYVLPALLVFLLFVLATEWKDSTAARLQ
jgi:hypothetical protein